MTILLILGFLLLCGLASAWARFLQRRAWVWFLVACFCSPLIAYIVLLVLSTKKTTDVVATTFRKSAVHRKVYQEHGDEFYETALTELQESRPVRPLWAKALVAADGDEAKARAIYIKNRCLQLVQAAIQHTYQRPEQEPLPHATSERDLTDRAMCLGCRRVVPKSELLFWQAHNVYCHDACLSILNFKFPRRERDQRPQRTETSAQLDDTSQTICEGCRRVALKSELLYWEAQDIYCHEACLGKLNFEFPTNRPLRTTM